MPKKVGLAPVQREGMEYEMSVCFDIGMDHHAVVSKDRTGIFNGEIFLPTRETGKKLIGWLNTAHELPEVKTEEKIVS